MCEWMEGVGGADGSHPKDAQAKPKEAAKQDEKEQETSLGEGRFPSGHCRDS